MRHCYTAGIRVILITGDCPGTARIARFGGRPYGVYLPLVRK